MYEHQGNGEHPQSLERRRQLLVWRSLAVLVVFGAALGLVRLVLGLLSGAPAASLVYQAVLLAINALVGLLVVARLRSLRRRSADTQTAPRCEAPSGRPAPPWVGRSRGSKG